MIYCESRISPQSEYPEQWKVILNSNHKTTAWLGGAILLVMLVLALSFQAFEKMKEATESRHHSLVLLNDANNFLSALKDMETGQRGYLLTGDELFLQPYVAVINKVHGQLNDLRHEAEGSQFWFELNSSANAEKLTEKKLAPSLPLHHGMLFYVEDNPANIKLVKQIIARRPGFRLLTAENALDGIDMARTFLPDVVLMDINLPGMSGIEALHILLTDTLTSHIPVMAISANAMPMDIKERIKSGFFRYLTKPIKIDEFADSLDIAVEFSDSHKKPSPA